MFDFAKLSCLIHLRLVKLELLVQFRLVELLINHLNKTYLQLHQAIAIIPNGEINEYDSRLTPAIVFTAGKTSAIVYISGVYFTTTVLPLRSFSLSLTFASVTLNDILTLSPT